MEAEQIVQKVQVYVLKKFGKSIRISTVSELHNALASVIVDELLVTDWLKSQKSQEKVKTVFYLSAEFLLGRVIFNNLLCLGIYDQVKALLAEKGFLIDRFEEIEDAALGNGGLGRLAACFLDSAATLKVPLNGYGIYYKFGYFRQVIENGFQVEYADDWTRFGDCWSVKRESDSVLVEFKDQIVKAVAHDIPIIGYKNSYVCTLRLWEACATDGFDLELFNKGDYAGAFSTQNRAATISSVLYPNDETSQGKELRLKQQYFFCSASVQDVIRRYCRNFGSDFSSFAKFNVFQINDTHPVLAIVEFVRILCEKENLSFDEAFKIAKSCFAYTNHTVMAEALEKWPLGLFERVIPNVLVYIIKIQKEFEKEMVVKNLTSAILQDVSPIQHDVINMANLAVYGTFATNGVAQIHTNILKNVVLKNWYAIYPKRFNNKTNGVTQRRWLLLANERLAGLITKLLDSRNWITDLSQLKKLEDFAQNKAVLSELIKIKKENHLELVDYLKKMQDLQIDPDTIFDVQIKRLHEYKRQFLNVLAILHIYFKIDEGSLVDFPPTTFIFGAKAAPSYMRAKFIIKLINSVARLIQANDRVRKFINVVFVADYNVSYAEKLVAAANVSEQISTAGTEASGTGNMKFMLNGAVTLGTYDGANVEIVQEAGRENNYIFGNTVEQLRELSKTYNPQQIYENDRDIKRVLDALDSGLLDDGGTGGFLELKNSILKGASWHRADQYYLLADFHSFVDAKLRCAKDYCSSMVFFNKCFKNIANAGKFSSDRTIVDYAKDIWKVKLIK